MKKKIVKTYPYQDESGEVLFEVVRYEPKAFRQRRPDGKGGWIWNLDGVRRVPYRLPELLKASPQDFVFITEGEKDSDRLCDLGFTATTNPGGACKWLKEYNRFFAGRLVAVLPDNDTAGKKHAEQVANSLYGVAGEIRIVEMPDLPEKGDVSDWLDNGGDSAKLLKLVDAAEPYEPPTSAPRLVIECMGNIEAESIEWFWDNKIPDGALTIISGDPGCSKSYLSIYMAARITRGEAWPDCPDVPVRKGSVLLFSDEDDPARVIRPRLDAHQADAGKVYLLRGVKVEESTAQFDISLHLAALNSKLDRIPDCRLVVLDPITAYLGGINANSNAEVRAALGPLAELAARRRVTVIGINHHNKQEGLKHIYRGLGSTAFVAQARSVWAVMIDKDDREIRIFCPIKSNYGIEPTGLKYHIIDGVVVFESEPWTGHIDDIQDEPRSTHRLDEAADWLREILPPGTSESSESVFERGKDKGFGTDLLYRAKRQLGIKAEKIGFGGQWFWRLPNGE